MLCGVRCQWLKLSASATHLQGGRTFTRSVGFGVAPVQGFGRMVSGYYDHRTRGVLALAGVWAMGVIGSPLCSLDRSSSFHRVAERPRRRSKVFIGTRQLPRRSVSIGSDETVSLARRTGSCWLCRVVLVMAMHGRSGPDCFCFSHR